MFGCTLLIHVLLCMTLRVLLVYWCIAMALMWVCSPPPPSPCAPACTFDSPVTHMNLTTRKQRFVPGRGGREGEKRERGRGSAPRSHGRWRNNCTKLPNRIRGNPRSPPLLYRKERNNTSNTSQSEKENSHPRLSLSPIFKFKKIG